MADIRKKMPRPTAVADLLAAAFHGTPVEKRLKEGRIWIVWDSAVGPQIAGRARPVAFRDGILTVAVTSAPWMQQLAFLKKGIMEKLNALLGEELVREIFLKAGGRGQREPLPSPASGNRPQRQLTEVHTRLIEKRTASISDPELHEAFVRLLTRHLADIPDGKRRQ
jgi:predicted nucleic acid-binding Zn ribbon protein